MQYLVLIGVAIEVVGFSAYIKNMFTGKTKPNRVTWLCWSIAPMIASLAAISNGATWSVLPTFLSGFGPIIVFILSFFIKGAYWKLSMFDYLCGFFSILAVVLWIVTSNPVMAVVFSVLADLSAALPTLRKAWKHPETETALTYFLGIFSMCTTFAAITNANFVNLAFPIYLVITNIVLCVFILRKRLPVIHR